MDAMTTLPLSRPMTRADLADTPDGGYRYELVDGTLIVTPAPTWQHQQAVLELAVLLRAACPNELQVFVAPVDVVLADDTVLQPDVLVARRCDLGGRDLPAAPGLAVEVLSPSTRGVDLALERSRYEAAGCASYWVVDPDQPSLTVWELVDGAYVEVAHVEGEETWRAARPFEVTLQPSALAAPPA